MTAHRYWRIGIIKQSGSSTVRVSEVQMRTSVGGSNVATGGSVLGTDNATDPPAKAFDSNSTSYWAITSNSNEMLFLGYDFGVGSSKDIVELAIEFNAAIGSTSVIPGGLRLEHSDDGVAWTIVSPGFVPTASFGIQIFGPVTALGSSRVSAQSAIRVSPGWPNPTAFVKRAAGLTLRNCTQDGGTYRIFGTIKVDGSPDTPVARKVVLFDQVSLRVLQSTFSNATTGAYEFLNLANKPHMVMSFDYTESFRAVVADRVMPELMT